MAPLAMLLRHTSEACFLCLFRRGRLWLTPRTQALACLHSWTPSCCATAHPPDLRGPSQGVFHVELKFTSRGPRLIEVNCRMGGGPVRDTNLRVWGVDLVEEHLLASLRIPTKPLTAAAPLSHLAEYSLNAKRSGAVQRTDFMEVGCARAAACAAWARGGRGRRFGPEGLTDTGLA